VLPFGPDLVVFTAKRNNAQLTLHSSHLTNPVTMQAGTVHQQVRFKFTRCRLRNPSTLLSLAPLVIFVIAIIAFVFGREHAQTWILQQVAELVGRQGADTIRNLVQHAHRSSSSGLIASVTGVITLLFGASGVFAELRSGLDTVWDFQSRTKP
jgi:hypothetical protein